MQHHHHMGKQYLDIVDPPALGIAALVHQQVTIYPHCFPWTQPWELVDKTPALIPHISNNIHIFKVLKINSIMDNKCANNHNNKLVFF